MLQGLFDESQFVRVSIEKEILAKMSVDSIMAIFDQKENQKSSLKIIVKDVIQKIPMDKELLIMLKYLLTRLEIEEEEKGYSDGYSSKNNKNEKEYNINLNLK